MQTKTKRSIVPVTFITLISAFVVTGAVFAATTIGTNIDTGGNLTVTGTTTLTGALTANGNVTFS
jgi:ABC-type transporter Mla subunit MlaD